MSFSVPPPSLQAQSVARNGSSDADAGPAPAVPPKPARVEIQEPQLPARCVQGAKQFIGKSSAGIMAAHPEQEATGSMEGQDFFSIYKNKFTKRLAELEKNNLKGKQDRKIDLDLAPLFYLPLNLKYPKENVIRLDSVLDLIHYVNQLCQKRDPNAPPEKQLAAVTVDGRTHDVQVTIAADRRKVQIRLIDSLEDTSQISNRVFAQLEAGLSATIGPDIRVDYYSSRNQRTRYTCEMMTYHATKQVIKQADKMGHLPKGKPVALSQKKPAEASKRAMWFTFMPDARSHLPPAFAKPLQNPALRAGVRDAATEIVTQSPGRSETSEQRFARTTQRMRIMREQHSYETMPVNTTIQRLRTRTYQDVLALLNQIEQQHGQEGASAALLQMAAATAPLRPLDWACCMPSWPAYHADPLNGLLQTFKEAEFMLAKMNPEQRAGALCEIVAAIPGWQSPTARTEGLQTVEKALHRMNLTAIPNVHLVFCALNKLNDLVKNENNRPDRHYLERMINASARKALQAIPPAMRAQATQNVSAEFLSVATSPDFPSCLASNA